MRTLYGAMHRQALQRARNVSNRHRISGTPPLRGVSIPAVVIIRVFPQDMHRSGISAIQHTSL